jgi:uncharacterized damage-inducible protein DinB
VNLADYLRREFSYNTWANEESLKAIDDAGGGDARSIQLMAHIFAAERVWLERLTQQPQSVAVWPQFDLERCRKELSDLAQKWHEYLDLATAGDISQTISYKNTKGEAYNSAIVDVLTHVITHSAYHRGQIASHMREQGLSPAYTDFIHGIRQGFVK